MCRLPPTTQTSPGPLPHTEASEWLVPLLAADHALPFQCSSVPDAPEAHTSPGPLRQMPKTFCVVPLGEMDQVLPFLREPTDAARARAGS